MKRYGNMKHIWCNYETLLTAYNEVKKGKTYNNAVLQYENNLAVNLTKLMEKLDNGTYSPKPAFEFTITEPKERLIQAPHFEDRIVQHASLIAVRQPIEKRFIHQTFACLKDRGTHKASDLLKKYLQNFKNEGYYLKVDIQKYFYSIDHKILEQQLAKIIKCKPTLELLKKFYENDAGVGLPLGNVTSQVLANLALNPVDHFLKRVCKHKYVIRYMDDLIIVDGSRNKLKKTLLRLNELITNLNLKINNKTHIGKIESGIDFVGYKTWFNRRIIRKRSLYAIKRKLKKEPSINRISSFLSHSKRTNSIVYVVKKILEIVPEQIQFIKIWLNNNRGDLLYEIF